MKGVIPAMVTPLTKNQELDESGLREVTNYLVESRVHGVFVCGTQGESYALNEEEKKRIVKVTVDEVNGRVPVYAGTGGITTRETIKLSKYAKDAGADAISVITPFFTKPTQSELYTHYKAIAEEVDLPVLLYNNPDRTGVNIDATTVKRLSEIENIVGIKDSSGDLGLIGEFIRTSRKGFAVMCGRDSIILASLVYGAKGAVAATANVVPELVIGIYESFIEGDLEKAKTLQLKLLPLRSAFSLGTFPVVIKEAMNLIGKPAGPARSPVSSLSEEHRLILQGVLKDVRR